MYFFSFANLVRLVTVDHLRVFQSFGYVGKMSAVSILVHYRDCEEFVVYLSIALRRTPQFFAEAQELIART